MTPATAADVRDRIAAGRSDLVAATTRLVEIATENPPAAAYPECVSALVDLVEDAGLEPEVIELETPDGAPRAAVRSFVGEGPTLWFHGHYDVVPAQHAAPVLTRRPRRDAARPRQRGHEGWPRGDAPRGSRHPRRRRPAQRPPRAPVRAGRGDGRAGGSAALSRAGLLAADGIGMLSPEPTGGIAWNGCRGAISLRVTVKGTSAHVGLSHTGVNAFAHMLEVASALRDLAAEVGERRTAYAIEPDAVPQFHPRCSAARCSRVRTSTSCPAGARSPSTAASTPRRISTKSATASSPCWSGSAGDGHDIEVEIFQEEPAAARVGRHRPGPGRSRQQCERSRTRDLRFELCPGLLEIRFYAGPRRARVLLRPGPARGVARARRACRRRRPRAVRRGVRADRARRARRLIPRYSGRYSTSVPAGASPVAGRRPARSRRRAAAWTIRCESCGAGRVQLHPLGPGHEPAAHGVVACRQRAHRLRPAARPGAAAARRALIARERRADEQLEADEARDRVPGQPEDERAGRGDAEPERLARLVGDPPEHLLDAERGQRRLDVVVRPDRDAARRDDDVGRLDRARRASASVAARSSGTTRRATTSTPGRGRPARHDRRQVRLVDLARLERPARRHQLAAGRQHGDPRPSR